MSKNPELLNLQDRFVRHSTGAAPGFTTGQEAKDAFREGHRGHTLACRSAADQLVHETMEDSDIRKLVNKMMDDEVTSILPEVPGIDLTEYKKTLIERFANPAPQNHFLISRRGIARERDSIAICIPFIKLLVENDSRKYPKFCV